MKKEVTMPEKGTVSRLKTKRTMAIVNATGNRITSPVMKYFFMRYIP